jgi:signal peptidase II
MIITIFLNISCDQVTKHLAREHLYDRGTIKVVHTFFVLRYAENTGAFLGFGSDIPEPFKFIFLSLFPTLFLLGLFIYISRNKQLTLFQIICLSSIFGGGIGNLIDRLTNNGTVVDFMNFGINGLRTGILNFADLSLTFGAIFFIISLYKRKEEKNIFL